MSTTHGKQLNPSNQPAVPAWALPVRIGLLRVTKGLVAALEEAAFETVADSDSLELSLYFMRERWIQRTLTELVKKHEIGDWGETSIGSVTANSLALQQDEGQVLSAHKLPTGKTVWVITLLSPEPGITQTTVMMPEEY